MAQAAAGMQSEEPIRARQTSMLSAPGSMLGAGSRARLMMNQSRSFDGLGPWASEGSGRADRHASLKSTVVGDSALAPLEEAPAPPQSWCQKEWMAIKETFFSGHVSILVGLNSLICFVPFGVVAGYAGWGSLHQFGFNFLAIVPLAAILGIATESMAAHVGPIIGGLMNATLGNMVEMCVACFALRDHQTKILQMSLIGSVLSNLLLVLGMSFFAASYNKRQADFNSDGASSNISCLVLASISLTLPTAFQAMAGTDPEKEVLMMSRIIAIIMGMVYLAFLVFQLGTHQSFFIANTEEHGEALEEPPATNNVSPGTACTVLALTTVTIGVCSKYLVDSIEGLCADYGMPKAFLGLILLPIVGNAAEHTTAITAAYHDMIDLSMNVAIGSCTQIALFVVPFTVILGWFMDVPMSLDFELFDSITFIISVFIFSGIVQDGNGNWLEGLMLVCTYIIIATVSWYMPDTSVGMEGVVSSGGTLRQLGELATQLTLSDVSSVTQVVTTQPLVYV